MISRLLFGAIAAGLLIVFLAPVLLKLGGDYALFAVVLAGVVLMLIDLVQSLRS